MNGKVVGYRKAVPQIAYYELINSGHFAYQEQADVICNILKELLPSGENHNHNEQGYTEADKANH